MFRLVIHCLVSVIWLVPVFQGFGQDIFDSITYPDCESTMPMQFDVAEILSTENRFLFNGSLEKIEGLYCYAKKIGNLELEAVSLFLLAEEHMTSNIVSNSFQLGIAYINRAITLCRENGHTDTLLSAKEILCSNLNAYEMFDEAQVCCNEFLDIARSAGDSVRIAEGHMLLGRVLRDREEFAKSDSILRRGMDFLQDSEASRRVAVYINLHLSSVASEQNKYKKALDYAHTGLALSETAIYQKAFMQALLGQQIVLCELELGNYDNEAMFQLIRKYAQGESWVTGYYYDTRAEYFKKMGQIDSAIAQYYKALDFYKDIGINIAIVNTSNDLLQTLRMKNELSDKAYDVHTSIQEAVSRIDGYRKRVSSFERTYYQLKNEKNKSESLQKKVKSYYRILLLSSGAIVLLLCVGVLIYKQYRLKKRYNAGLNELNSQLVLKNEKLAASKKEIEEKNEKVLSELKTQLALISGYDDQLKKLERTFYGNTSLDSDFKARISKMLDFKKNKDVVEDINLKLLETNKELVSKLSHTYPNLTNNDLKLCLYLKMNLSTKEIAQLQHKTVESIKVARFRLRKKINISDSSVKLATFINAI